MHRRQLLGLGLSSTALALVGNHSARPMKAPA